MWEDISKVDPKKYDLRVWTGLICLGDRGERGNEPSTSIKGRVFLAS